MATYTTQESMDQEASHEDIKEMMVVKAHELFVVCDKEEKGFITKRDMQRLQNELPLTPEQLEDVFDSLDDDGNGYLTLQEFTEGFGSFLGLATTDHGSRHSLNSVGSDERVYEDGAAGGGDDEANFDDMLNHVGAKEVFDDMDTIKTLWDKLKVEQPELLGNFEDFLGRVTTDIKRSQNDFQSLESALRTKSSAHDEEVRKLYEEMEQQIKLERERVVSEEKAKERQLKEEMERDMQEKDRQLQELLLKHQDMETRLLSINQTEAETKQENEKITKERDRLENLLEHSQDHLEESRSHITELRSKQRNDKRDRAMAAMQMSEGIALERESLVKQLEMLREMNRKLRDERDEADIRRMSHSIEKQLEEVGDRLGKLPHTRSCDTCDDNDEDSADNGHHVLTRNNNNDPHRDNHMDQRRKKFSKRNQGSVMSDYMGGNDSTSSRTQDSLVSNYMASDSLSSRNLSVREESVEFDDAELLALDSNRNLHQHATSSPYNSPAAAPGHHIHTDSPYHSPAPHPGSIHSQMQDQQNHSYDVSPPGGDRGGGGGGEGETLENIMMLSGISPEADGLQQNSHPNIQLIQQLSQQHENYSTPHQLQQQQLQGQRLQGQQLNDLSLTNGEVPGLEAVAGGAVGGAAAVNGLPNISAAQGPEVLHVSRSRNGRMMGSSFEASDSDFSDSGRSKLNALLAKQHSKRDPLGAETADSEQTPADTPGNSLAAELGKPERLFKYFSMRHVQSHIYISTLYYFKEYLLETNGGKCLGDINQSVMVKNLDARHLGFSPFQTGLYQTLLLRNTDSKAPENHSNLISGRSKIISRRLGDHESDVDNLESSSRREPVGANSCNEHSDAFLSASDEAFANKSPERLFKVVFVGDSGVGKSCFIHRFCSNTFRHTFSATIGVDFQCKNVVVDGHVIALQLWDTAGQERFRSITKQYFRKADGVIIMYDVTSETSFRNVQNWMVSVQEGVDEGTVLTVVGNKMDLIDDYDDNRVVSTKTGSRLADDYGALFYETSAKTGLSCRETMQGMASLLQEREDRQIEKSFNIAADDDVKKKKGGCCGD